MLGEKVSSDPLVYPINPALSTPVCVILYRVRACFLLLYHEVPLWDEMRLSDNAGGCGFGDSGGKLGRVHVPAGVALGYGEGRLPTWETERGITNVCLLRSMLGEVR